MPLEQLLPLAGFVIVMTGTPGPNNLMLMASGARFGFRRSVPHILGITVGCQALLAAVALGLGSLLTTWPPMLTMLRWGCVVILLYLAWMLVKPVPSGTGVSGPPRPLTFIEAALFQWVNPKAWMMMLAAVTTYIQPASPWSSLLLLGAFFAVLGMPLISIWNLFGVSLKRFLQKPVRARVFNGVMAVLLLASLYPVLGGF
jgi:threonine/homoserine/homoserine lactone efflux protein